VTTDEAGDEIQLYQVGSSDQGNREDGSGALDAANARRDVEHTTSGIAVPREIQSTIYHETAPLGFWEQYLHE
jgi:hypothetical protein